MEYYSVIQMNKLLINVITSVNPYVEQKKPYTEKYIPYHSIYIKFKNRCH